MRSSEWIALLYFAYLAGACWLRRLPASRRMIVTAASLFFAVAVRQLARSAPAVVRDWAPALYILAGYYISGWLFAAPSQALEAWLMAWDRRLLGDPTTRFARWPRALVAYLEIVYVFCFLIVPAGYAALVFAGYGALADRYWTMVAAAEFAAFAPLSLFQTRPPWLLEREPELADPAVHGLASRMIRTLTIRVNTFPSGHVAGSLAVALAVVGAMPLTGAILFVLAASITVACVVGRYHYVVDVVTGAALAVAIRMVLAIRSV